MKRKPISGITQNYPNDPGSPFFDEDGNSMNPIAKLHFRRQRLYNNICDNTEPCNENEETTEEPSDEEEKNEEKDYDRVSDRNHIVTFVTRKMSFENLTLTLLLF